VVMYVVIDWLVRIVVHCGGSVEAVVFARGLNLWTARWRRSV
jgi:hypothetical protein